ncbi:hypothetical protein [Clostridium botulinum]
MFRINRIKIIVNTVSGKFGFDNTFDKKINFIASNDNTKGKSSCIESIYYCLGLEELIGGKNEQALKTVFRRSLKYKSKYIDVLYSEFYLEIQNDNNKVITIYRTTEQKNRKSNLITIYYGMMDSIPKNNLDMEDMYVHLSGGATNQKGFHRFLEEFIGWELPFVPTYDDVDRKLYIQTIFSALFVEQKRGWSDIFANIPTYLKIRESKKRVIEFLLGLNTLELEKLREKCKQENSKIKSEWKSELKHISDTLNQYNCSLKGIPIEPKVLDENFINEITFFKNVDNDYIPVEKFIIQQKHKLKNIENNKTNVGENIDNIQIELLNKNEEISKIENILRNEREKLMYENSSINLLVKNLEIINKDLINNKDAKKIKSLGSLERCHINRDICPTCNQKINDSLLPQDINYNVMSIDENIKHLESQKLMLEFAIRSHKKNIKDINGNICRLEAKIFTLRRVIRSLINDINSNDNCISEADVHKKIIIENNLEDLKKIKQELIERCKVFKTLSKRWEQMLNNKKMIPKDKLTDKDKLTLNILATYFRNNLKKYRYSSISNFDDIKISDDKFLPIIQEFDMKFNSSASDNIRAIWAFAMALMQTSNKIKGNHPKVLIFDEPGQQSVVPKDLENFIKQIASFNSSCQVIIGITFKDIDTKEIFEGINDNIYKLLLFDDRMIVPIRCNDIN